MLIDNQNSEINIPMENKTLGVVQLTALVFGNMVGSGTFMLPAALASFGSIGLLAWLATACGAMVLALVFSRLSRLYPKTGGPYIYCREAYGNFVGFVVAYCYWIATWIGNAAIVIALIGSLAFFFPILKIHTYALGFGLAVLWIMTAINIKGVKEAGFVQLITAIMKFVPLLAIAVMGLFYVDLSSLGEFNVSHTSNISAFAAASALTLWSFIGFESATVPVGNVRNPKRDVPIATVLGTLLAALVYIFGTAVIMGLVPMDVLAKSPAPYALAAEKIFGARGADFVGIVSVIAILGTLNGWVLMQAQVTMAAANDKLFPSRFGHVNEQGTPVFGLVISSVLISVLLFMHADDSLVEEFTLITELAVVATLIPYLFSSMAEFIYMLRHPHEYQTKSKRITTVVLALLALGFAFFAFVGVDSEIMYYVFLLLLSSVPAYTWLIWSQK